MQIASFLRHILLSPVACLDISYFYTLSHYLHDFRGKNIETELKIKCFLRTDKHDKAIGLFRQFCERAYKHTVTYHKDA